MVGFGALATCSGRSARVEMVGYGARATCSGRSARVEMVGYGARATCSGRSARVEMVGQACSGSADLQVGVQHLVFGPPEPASAGDSFLVDLFNIQRARISPHFFQTRRRGLSAKPSNTLQWKSAALPALPQQVFPRRDGRVAEGARLESVCTRKGTQGSNPCLSAIPLESAA
jgi:hypothetical protein